MLALTQMERLLANKRSSIQVIAAVSPLFRGEMDSESEPQENVVEEALGGGDGDVVVCHQDLTGDPSPTQTQGEKLAQEHRTQHVPSGGDVYHLVGS